MRRGRPRHDDVLTPREWQVLDLVRDGLTNEQIADRLGISYDTAKFHVSEILSKLGVESRREAAAWRGKPRVSFGFAPVAAMMGKGFGTLSPMKVVGGGAIVAALTAFVLLAVGVLLSDSDDSLGKIAFVRDGNIWVQELPDGTPYQLTDKGASAMPQWSPSDEWLLYWHRPDSLSGPGFEHWVISANGTEDRLLEPDGMTSYWFPGTGDRAIVRTEAASVFHDVETEIRDEFVVPHEEGNERVYSSAGTKPGRGAYCLRGYPVSHRLGNGRVSHTLIPRRVGHELRWR